MTKTLTAIGIAALSLSLTACDSDNPVSPTPESSVSGSGAGSGTSANLTIVGIVLQEDGEFDVLQAAVIRAGLADALNGTAQYTVFAPSDQAFVSSLGAADEAAAIAAVNGLPLETLRDILLFHVTEGRKNSTAVLAASSYQMLNGATLSRSQLTAAGIAATDIAATNGIVHVINAVLFPSR